MSESTTGIYAGTPDGGFYYARFVAEGSRFFWFGEHPDGHFANVMVGTLSSFPGRSELSVEDCKWLDVPKGNAGGGSVPGRSETELELLIAGSAILKETGSGTGFGGTNWTKLAHRPRRGPVNLTAPAGEGLTGVWMGNDDGVYYIRQRGSDVFWFGEQCVPLDRGPAFANVFVGSISGAIVSGSWADVPYGETRGFGGLSLTVDGDTLVRTGVTGGFGGTRWTRMRLSGTTRIDRIQVALSTVGDDVRAGSHVYGSVELRDGRVVGRIDLNAGRRIFPSPEPLVAELVLPSPVQRNDLKSFILEFDGAPRHVFDEYDDWRVDRIVVSFRRVGFTCAGKVHVKSEITNFGDFHRLEKIELPAV